VRKLLSAPRPPRRRWCRRLGPDGTESRSRLSPIPSEPSAPPPHEGRVPVLRAIPNA